MKKVLSIGFVIVLLVASVSMASAQLGTTDRSSFAIQNLGADTATITVTFYEEDGTSHAPTDLGAGQTNPFTLGKGEGWEIYVPGIPDTQLADGRYSVVIESTEPIAVISNLIGDTATFSFNGSYSGFDQGGQEVYLPSIFYNYYGWYSLVSVQNVTANPVDIDVEYYNGADHIATHSKTGLAAYASVHFDWETNAPTPLAGKSLPAPNSNPLSAVVKVVGGTGSVVAVDNQTVPASGYMQSYNGFLAGAQTWYAPSLFNSYYGWFSSMLIQNVGTADADVTVDYNDTVADDTFTLKPKETKQLMYRNDQTPGHGVETVFGATISADNATDKIVAIVNQASWPDAATYPHSDQAQTYNAFPAGSNNWGLPSIFQKYYGWDTSFSMQNVDDTANAVVTIKYSANQNPLGTAWAGCTFSKTLGPGENVEYYQPSHKTSPPTGCTAIPDNYQGSVSLTSVGAPIVAQVNETNDGNKTAVGGDWSMSYNGFGE
jgi:hypothetical protein